MVDKNELKSLADSLQETWDSMDGVINPFLVLAHTAICWHSTKRPAPSQPAALAVPLFLLHTGTVYGNERGDWEIEANSGKAVDAYCDANPGKTIGLYLATPAQQPAAAVLSREDLLGAIGRGWTHATTKHMPVDVTLAVAIEKEVRAAMLAAQGVGNE